MRYIKTTIKNYLLFVLLLSGAKNTYSMNFNGHAATFRYELETQRAQNPLKFEREKLITKLNDAIDKGNCRLVKQLFNDPNFDIKNLEAEPVCKRSFLAVAIQCANQSFFCHEPNRFKRLKIIKLFLTPLNINLDALLKGPQRTALEYALSFECPSIDIIKLLINHGPAISARAFERITRKDQWSKLYGTAILELIKKSLPNLLLMEMLSNNREMVQNIIDCFPDLITREVLQYIRAETPTL